MASFLAPLAFDLLDLFIVLLSVLVETVGVSDRNEGRVGIRKDGEESDGGRIGCVCEREREKGEGRGREKG